MEDTTRTAELRRKLDKDPGSRLFAQLAEELRKEGRHEEAIGVARKGLEKNPNYPSARLTLARSLLDSGRSGEARPELEQIVKASPDNILAGRLLGEALADLGEAALALERLEVTLRLSPGDKAISEKIAELKARKEAPAAPPPPALDVEAPSVLSGTPEAPGVPEVLTPIAPVEVPAVALPSVTEAALPAISMPVELPAVSMPEAAVSVGSPSEVSFPPEPTPVSAASSMALDRDLASGTLSPGVLTVSELMHFEAASGSSLPEPPPEDREAGQPQRPLDHAQLAEISEGDLEPSAVPSAPPSVPSVFPAEGTENPDVGGQTLPLTSMTLADLYLQQGLKAEATAVLSQVMKEEPENAQARSRFAEVAAGVAANEPSSTAPSPAPARAARSRAERCEDAIASLKAFQSALEREALQQKATEQRSY